MNKPDDEEMVIISRQFFHSNTGAYHSSEECLSVKHMSKGTRKVTVAVAEERGGEPCKRCFGEVEQNSKGNYGLRDAMRLYNKGEIDDPISTALRNRDEDDGGEVDV